MSQRPVKTQEALSPQVLKVLWRTPRTETTAIVPYSPPPAVDLERLQAILEANRRASEVHPTDLARKVLVDAEGRIRLGEDAVDESAAPLSNVQQAVFGGAPRMARENLALQKMPAGTRSHVLGHRRGWLYEVTTAHGDQFQFFAFFQPNASSYRVKVTSPDLTQHRGQRCHLFEDGFICLSHGGTMRGLEDAYAKSCLWAAGFSVFLRRGTFPF